MSLIIPVRGKTPLIHESCWIAPTASIIGDVTLEEDCTVWFSSVIRGDVCSIKIGARSNIQDGAIIHGTYKKSKTVIGARVSIAHGAIIHGCTIHDDVLVGMKAVIMDNAIVESNVIVAAGAVVLEDKVLEAGHIYAGVPAKKIKAIDPEQTQWHISRTADAYLKYASWYQEES